MNKSNKFEKLYDRIVKIIELYPKIPPNLWEEVFKSLYDAALEGDELNIFEKEILTKSKEMNLKISDIVDVQYLKSYIDKSLYFVFFLELLQIENITFDHIYACYSISGEQISSTKLSQNLRDLTGSKYNYLSFNGESYSITNEGKIACVKKNFILDKTM